MKLMNVRKKWIALSVMVAFLFLVEAAVFPRDTEAGAAGYPGKTEISPSSDSPNLLEKASDSGSRVHKKHFPWLIVIGVVVLAGAAYYYFYMLKNTLTVNVGDGVEGTPEAGSTEHARSDKVSYSYSLAAGYRNLAVTLDGASVAASGTVTMSKSHTLAATAIKQVTLTVSVDAGVDGTPVTGSYTYDAGQTVTYGYSLKAGFTNLVVKLDGVAVSAGGTITMNSDHTLTATSTGPAVLYVTRGTGVTGTPSTGNYSYTNGTTVNYSYGLTLGYYGLVVKVDEAVVPGAGTVLMNMNHTLTADAINGRELEWLFNGSSQDSSGNGRHGTQYNTSLVTDHKGVVSRAYYFNGTNAYVQGPSFIAQVNKCVSVSMWVKIPATSTLKYFLDGNGYSFFQDGTKVGFAVHVSATDSTSYSIPTGSWVHMVGTYDGAMIRLYRNGALVGWKAHAGTPWNFGWKFTVGKRAASADYWKGYVDDVRVYSYTLSAAEISTLAGM